MKHSRIYVMVQQVFDTPSMIQDHFRKKLQMKQNRKFGFLSLALSLVVSSFMVAAPAQAFDVTGWAGRKLIEKAVQGGASHQTTTAAGLKGGTGFAACPQFFPYGIPVVPDTFAGKRRELCFDSFAVLYSGESKTPIYVVEHLSRDQLLDAKDEERTNKFFEDARLPAAERATLEDYARPGTEEHYDRGHQAPAGDMPNAQSMAQSFSLANMVPQNETHNRKTWRNIESSTRKYAMRAQGGVLVYTGPLFNDRPVKKIGRGGVWVPTHLTKAVYDETTGQSWVHYSANTREERVGRPMAYADYVRRGGIPFFANAPHPQQ